MQGAFCHQCGQETVSDEESLWGFIRQSATDVLSLRSRTVRSLVDLVLRPGALTRSHLLGQRARFTKPVQLYLIAAALFFVANSFQPFVRVTDDNQFVSSLSVASTGSDISPARLNELASKGVSLEVFRERVGSAVSQSLPPFMVGSIVAFALALKLFGPRRPLLHHVVAALHWVAFFMLLMALERILPLPGILGQATQALFALVALLHLVVSLHNAYDYGWPRSVASGLALFVLFNLILIFWVLAVVAFAFRIAA